MATVSQPSGTVTLVFTDIEGSTRLLDGLGAEGYRQALAEHQRIVRAAFAQGHGYEVDTAGDGFFYAFATAAEAAQAVREALVGLDGGPIRIRVGIHTGEPIVDPPRYVGIDVHRAARIMASANGGQALLSRTTRDLLDENVAVRDLGEHRLKDLSAPQRLFQLGTSDFPRPRTLERTNLPVPATEFLGRSTELAEVVEKLRDGVRLLTLTGPGGTGKTRLALQAAAEAADDFGDGVWWVPLASLRDPALVLRQTANTLDVIEQPDRSIEDVLAEMLGGKRMLVLLDNAEHLLPAAARAIATLRDLDGPKLVVTSRERLQLAGEHVYPVPQLTALEGLELFTTRAAALDPAFEASAAVAELCARLDNLPLAIELAAARTTVLTSEQILERLGGRLDLLRGGRDADPRQQTLRATIAWSYDLLAPDERDLFARFAVFAGGATLEAVEDVCAADIETLASLVDKSLIRRDGDRYWMLETIREFGIEQLDEAGRDEVIECHGAFFERFATEAEAALRQRDAAAWLGRVEQELPNLRAAIARALERAEADRALSIAVNLGRYWEARSSATEGRGWIDQALAAGTITDTRRAPGLFWAARLAFFQGDLSAADRFCADVMEPAEASANVYVEASALALWAWIARERGDPSATLVERSRKLLPRLTDPWERSEVLLGLGAAEFGGGTGDLQPIAEELLELKRRTGDVVAVSDALNNVGWAALLKGEYDHAISCLEEAVAIARELEDTFRITLALCNLGLAAVLQGRYLEAVGLLRETVDLCVRRGDRRCGAEAVLGLAAAAAGLGENELAVQLDDIHRLLFEDAGIVYVPTMVQRLGRLLEPARAQVGTSEAGEPSLELALELLAQSTSMASPNE